MEVDTKEKNSKCKLSPLVGESVNRQVDERGKREQKRKKRFLQNDSKYLPVILERSEESRQRMRVLNAFCDSPLCTPTAPFTSSMTAEVKCFFA